MSSFLLPFQSCLSSSSYRTLLTPCFLCPYLTPNSLSSSSLFSFTLSSSPLSFTLLLISSLIHSPPHLLSHSLSSSLFSLLPLLLIFSSSSSPSSSYSLSRSNKAIACLYSAVFPLFPSSTTDTRYHLQALRHLYVLAAEPRVLVTRDVETGQATSVEVCVRGEREIKGRTPCIVPEWSSINEVGEEVTRESGDDHVT